RLSDSPTLPAVQCVLSEGPYSVASRRPHQPCIIAESLPEVAYATSGNWCGRRACRGLRHVAVALVGVVGSVVVGQAVSTDSDGSAGETTGTRDNPWWCRIALLRMPVPMGGEACRGCFE